MPSSAQSVKLSTIMRRLTTAGSLMILVNIAFIVAGAILLRYKLTLEDSGWDDALVGTDYESVAVTATTVIQLLGIGAMALGLLGIVGAIVQNRLVLLLYSVVMVVATSAFGVLVGTAFAFKNKAKVWEEAAFPANDQENELAKTFNEVYCYAEGYYFCNSATAEETYITFFPDASTTLISVLPKITGIVSLCAQPVAMIDGLSTVCEACNMASQFTRYDKILTWAENKCPRNLITGHWCASFLATGAADSIYEGTPYGQCRNIFLDVVIDWSNSLAIAGLFVAISAAVIVVLACFSRRSKSFSKSENLPKK
ncbi:uncharacterized protein CCR75_005257 [Bremia lactucae]|uniref:Tetraspanin n=1 Tax=Bremia lactucae TaxID=4779 RepID=A0A976NYU6_BRELC|nr:hypothetical protein CCR75_005257 [Bremia lactucae]